MCAWMPLVRFQPPALAGVPAAANLAMEPRNDASLREEYQLPSTALELSGEFLGAGGFGEVTKGSLKLPVAGFKAGTVVAIKQLRAAHSNQDAKRVRVRAGTRACGLLIWE